MNFQSSEYKGLIEIEQYTQPPEDSGVGSTGFMDVTNGKIVQANGMDIIVVEISDGCALYYRDGNTIYTIDFYDTDFETGIKIAESIE